eukprot:CAMPEP_0119539296 /NCGR_PEP_ID=MMETSP1344-20130328/51486_1 /TAXON_ID=236787 /ORGANISM="Florenciella parvula, Strain CCMP2471" /LENGTH=96 /DNA_ID=CAMNT_0007582535 /DNA_START=1153 /DNA_END=1444 /DNA_ORIENTATION=-
MHNLTIELIHPHVLSVITLMASHSHLSRCMTHHHVLIFVLSIDHYTLEQCRQPGLVTILSKKRKASSTAGVDSVALAHASSHALFMASSINATQAL